MCIAQVEVVHILLAVAICEIGVVDGGREKVSPDILCSVISGYDAFQPSAIACGVYQSQGALGDVGKVRLTRIVRAASEGILIQIPAAGGIRIRGAVGHFVCGPTAFPWGSDLHLIYGAREPEVSRPGSRRQSLLHALSREVSLRPWYV